MRYRDLLAQLQKLSEDQLDMDVTVFDKHSEEYFAVLEMGIVTEEFNDDGVLDHSHPFLVFNEQMGELFK